MILTLHGQNMLKNEFQDEDYFHDFFVVLEKLSRKFLRTCVLTKNEKSDQSVCDVTHFQTPGRRTVGARQGQPWCPVESLC